MLKKYDLFYKADIPALAHKYLGGDTRVEASLRGFAGEQGAFADMGGDLVEFFKILYQPPCRILSLGIRCGMPFSCGIHGDLLGIQEVLQTC